MVKHKITVNIDEELFQQCKERNLNFSQICNNILRERIGEEEDIQLIMDEQTKLLSKCTHCGKKNDEVKILYLLGRWLYDPRNIIGGKFDTSKMGGVSIRCPECMEKPLKETFFGERFRHLWDLPLRKGLWELNKIDPDLCHIKTLREELDGILKCILLTGEIFTFTEPEKNDKED